MLSIRFFIGLRDVNRLALTEGEIRQALDALGRAFPSGITVTRGEGYWKGDSEPSMVVEAITCGRKWYVPPYVYAAAREVAGILSQSSVGLAVRETGWELIQA